MINQLKLVITSYSIHYTKLYEQIWWGHRIPAWYCDDCGAITVSRADATACEKCGSHKLQQETDVLDTWFSSALRNNFV